MSSERIICSRAQCTADAQWILVWRNPAIHPQGRTKAWTACPDHLDFLRDYLDNRSFLLTVTAVGEDDGEQ